MGWNEQKDLVQSAGLRVFSDGVPIDYEPAGLSNLTDILAVFRDESTLVDTEASDTGTISQAPNIEVQASFLSRDPFGIDHTGVRDVVVRAGVRYAVTTFLNDGFGMLTINLRRES